jgi:rhomboid family GlyGly-CTERM serine protease
MISLAACRRQMPWIFLILAVLALVIQLNPTWRDTLIYQRDEIGQFWRLWTGHWVHFGWPHFVVDVGLFLILGWMLEHRYPRLAVSSLVLMPLFISLVIYFFDSHMHRYAGLSALNLGLLLIIALQGWQRDWRDWFWPAVLVIYVAEIVFEIMSGGSGGGMIRFDDPHVKVATSAHIAGAVYAVCAWLLVRRQARAVGKKE